jgi:hypothetical protein
VPSKSGRPSVTLPVDTLDARAVLDALEALDEFDAHAAQRRTAGATHVMDDALIRFMV